MVNMRQALGVDDFNQMSNYTGQLQNKRRSVGQKDYGLGGKALDMAAALGDAYNQYQPPETALGMMALPAKAVYGLGNMIVQDVGDKTKSIMGTDRSNPAAMDQAATDAFGLAADTMAGGGVVSRMTDMPQGAILGANVFQGGPHKYGPEGAAESLKHMSKGEGAQAYGWGRYDAQSQGVGRDYRRSLAGTHKVAEIDGELIQGYAPSLKETKLSDREWEILNEVKGAAKTDLPNWASRAIARDAYIAKLHGVDKKEGFETALTKAWGGGDNLLTEPQRANVEAFYDEVYSALPETNLRDAGYLYKHDLPDEDIARYLDWDAPLSEQPESVRAAVKNIVENPSQLDGELGAASRLFKGEDMGFDSDYIQGITGDRLYNLIAALRTPGQAYASNFPTIKAGKRGFQDASEALAKAGIPGLKYFDGMSRPASSTKSLIEAAGSQEAALANARKRFDSADADWGPMADDHKRRWADAIRELEKPQTRNFVTWDQDVLNRMKLLERNGESMTKALMPK